MPVLTSACHKGYFRPRQEPIKLFLHYSPCGFDDQLVAAGYLVLTQLLYNSLF